MITELCASGITALNRDGNPAWKISGSRRGG